MIKYNYIVIIIITYYNLYCDIYFYGSDHETEKIVRLPWFAFWLSSNKSLILLKYRATIDF